MESAPLVSICCTAYNHERFIAAAVRGFLMQDVDFPIEILINDDASTDATPRILGEYELKHPDLIRVIYQEENQYTRGVKPFLHILYPQARGKYIALCEGDDHWTDPLKLRKQVGYMEAHPAITLTAGGYETVYPNGDRRVEVKTRYGKSDGQGFQFGLEEMKKVWLTKTLTVVFRRDALPPGWDAGYQHVRDVHRSYHVVKRGRAYYFRQVFGVYNVHPSGVHSMRHGRSNLTAAYKVRRELYVKNRDDYTRVTYLKAIVGLLLWTCLRGPGRWSQGCHLVLQTVRLLRRPGDLRWLLAGIKRFYVQSLKARQHVLGHGPKRRAVGGPRSGA